ncbi:MAG: hypothetical protein Q4B01_01920 [Eubacteriales bacterium]|nr:hypothetical protein [Eubacteriales bacterium]
MTEKRKPLLLDLHIPYCIQPENYLDYFHAIGSNAEKNMYLTCLGREILSYEGDLEDYEIRAIRMSGGSASVMSPDLLGKVLTLAREKLPVAKGAQVSYEALPNTVGTPHLTGIAAGHPNRVELMMRSESDEELRTLNCPFTMQDTRNALLFLNRFHMNNIGLTVNYGIPGQTMQSWKNTLHACVIIHPGHLRVEPLDQMKDWESSLALYEYAVRYLQENGYHQYKTGCFCLPNHEDRFELYSSMGTERIGLGVGNKSFFDGYIIRNTNNLQLYMKNAGQVEKVTAEVAEAESEEIMKTYLFGRLQLAGGFSTEEFKEKFSEEFPVHLREIVERLMEDGFAEESDGKTVLTVRGQYYFREICDSLQRKKKHN